MTITRPMLAETIEDVNSLNYSVIASPKLDGIRCLIVNGKAVTRAFKPIPNNFIRTHLELICPTGFDGELLIEGKTFNETQSIIMTEDHEEAQSFSYHVFDYTIDQNKDFFKRFNQLESKVEEHRQKVSFRIKIVPHKVIWSAKELLEYEAECLAAGYEGVMVRNPNGKYKCGRSTLKQGWLLKLKRFLDSEAKIIELKEMNTNTNDKETNELGLSKRSTKKAGMKLAGMLGKFVVQDIKTGVQFELGTGDGLTKELRKEIWENKDKYIGKLVKYKYQPSGQKDLPRFPVWLSFRSELDL